MADLQQAEEELEEKNRELATVKAKYDAAMKEKYVSGTTRQFQLKLNHRNIQHFMVTFAKFKKNW